MVNVGLVRRTRSVAAAMAPASGDPAAGTVPAMPLTERASMPVTPCTSAGCPVASDVHVRAGSGASDAGIVRRAPAATSLANVGVRPSAARRSRNARSRPSTATTVRRSPVWTRGSDAWDARRASLAARREKQHRRAAKEHQRAGAHGDQPRSRREAERRPRGVGAAGREGECGHGDRVAEEHADGGREAEHRPGPRSGAPDRAGRVHGPPPEHEVGDARQRDDRAGQARQPRPHPLDGRVAARARGQPPEQDAGAE